MSTSPLTRASPSGKQKKSYLCPCNVPVFVNFRIFLGPGQKEAISISVIFNVPRIESHTHDLFTTSLVVLLVLVVLIVLVLVLLW